jgi:hypothetical protein
MGAEHGEQNEETTPWSDCPLDIFRLERLTGPSRSIFPSFRRPFTEVGSITLRCLPRCVNHPGFLSSGKFPELAASLLQAHGSDTFIGSIVDALASQTGRTNPSAAFTTATGFVTNARLAPERVTTMKTDDFCDSFQNLQILGGRYPPHGFSRDNHTILKGLSATEIMQ